jgi:hypothetical protein
VKKPEAWSHMRKSEVEIGVDAVVLPRDLKEVVKTLQVDCKNNIDFVV